MKFSCNSQMQRSNSTGSSTTAIDAAHRAEKAMKTISYNPYVQQNLLKTGDKDLQQQLVCKHRCQSKSAGCCRSNKPSGRCASSSFEPYRSIDPSSQAYFHGLLTPELAEERLLMLTSVDYNDDNYNYERPDGVFLLRSCPDGDFAVSVLRRDGSVTHHPIVRSSSSSGYRLPVEDDVSITNKTFPGPVELLRGHPVMTKLARVPCPRPSGTSPLALAQGVTTAELARLSLASSFASSTGTEDIGRCVDQRSVLANLHRDRPWYHADCPDRDEAEQRLASFGHASGDFLVRCRSVTAADCSSSAQKKEFVLTLSWRREAWHYRILAWRSKQDWLAVEGANRGFPTLIELVDHYHLRSDGLMCRLRRAVPASSALAADETTATELTRPESDAISDWEFFIGIEQTADPTSPNNHQRAAQSPAAHNANTSHSPVQLRRNNLANRHSSAAAQPVENKSFSANGRRRTLLDDIVNDVSKAVVEVGFLQSDDVIQVRRLRLVEQLGVGRFGEVWRASVAIPSSDVGDESPSDQRQVLSVAARVLPESSSAPSAASAAYRLVEGLQHPNLLRLFGSVESQASSCCVGGARRKRQMLLMEWSSLGPADRYLRRHPDCPTEQLLNLCHQVSQAMAYLESRGLAHRCLSARNVLLFPDLVAKISSDFGLFDACQKVDESASAGRDGDSQSTVTRPHLWHAPEALQHGRFTCRSDVWSFGVTCWELFNRGCRLPFASSAGSCDNCGNNSSPSPEQLLGRLKRGERLTPPNDCSNELSNLLDECWRWAPEERPAFDSIQRRLGQMRRTCLTASPHQEETNRQSKEVTTAPATHKEVDEEEAGELDYCVV